MLVSIPKSNLCYTYQALSRRAPVAAPKAVAPRRAGTSDRLDPTGEACEIIQRSRHVSLANIPAGCSSLDDLEEALAPRGLEMMAAESFAGAVADIATYWREAWIRATSGNVASIEL